MASLTDRILRAAMFDPKLYEEVEADQDALGEAMYVVLLAGIAAGIGTIVEGGIIGLFIGAIGALISWFVWAYLTYYIGTRVLPEVETRANPGELLRTIGFSASPGLIRVLGLIPGLRGFVFFIGAVWMLLAMVLAVKQALDYRSTLRAVAVCVIGWIVMWLILFLFDLLITALA